MSKWKELLDRQQQERIALVASVADQGLTKSQAARELGLTKQSLHQFCKKHRILFGNNKAEG